MPYRPSRSFVSALSVLFALGAATAWTWHQLNSVPPELRAKLSWREALQYQPEPIHIPPTAEEIAADRREARALKAKLTAEFPALKITPRPVPDDQNGFLLMNRLGDGMQPPASRLTISAEFRKVITESSPWDPAIATRCLLEHAGLVKQIEHIAALTTRSSANMPENYIGCANARLAKNYCDILLVKARLAAEAGDESEALRLVVAAGNLGTHFHEVESPSLHSETAAILIDLNIQRIAFKTLLPALGRKANLGRWKTALGKRSYGTADLARVMRGEWDTATEFMTLPMLFTEARDQQLPDVEAVAWAYTTWFNTCVTRLPTCRLGDRSAAFQPPDLSTLSKQGQEIIDCLTCGCSAWCHGYVRSATLHAQYQAALELLIIEQTGTVLTAADAARTTRDPVSDAPFVLDTAKRELAAPPGAECLNITPLALPW